MLRKHLAVVTVSALTAMLALHVPAAAQPSTAADRGPDVVGVYTGSVPLGGMTELRRLGLDHESVRVVKGGQEAVTVEAIISGRQAKALQRDRPKDQNIHGVPVGERLRQKALTGQSIFRSYSEPGGLRDELVKTTEDHPSLAKLANVGQTTQGKPILAGAVVTTGDTVFSGFGLEGMDPLARNDFVACAMRHLLG